MTKRSKLSYNSNFCHSGRSGCTTLWSIQMQIHGGHFVWIVRNGCSGKVTPLQVVTVKLFTVSSLLRYRKTLKKRKIVK